MSSLIKKRNAKADSKKKDDEVVKSVPTKLLLNKLFLPANPRPTSAVTNSSSILPLSPFLKLDFKNKTDSPETQAQNKVILSMKIEMERMKN